MDSNVFGSDPFASDKVDDPFANEDPFASPTKEDIFDGKPSNNDLFGTPVLVKNDASQTKNYDAFDSIFGGGSSSEMDNAWDSALVATSTMNSASAASGGFGELFCVTIRGRTLCVRVC